MENDAVMKGKVLNFLSFFLKYGQIKVEFMVQIGYYKGSTV